MRTSSTHQHTGDRRYARRRRRFALAVPAVAAAWAITTAGSDAREVTHRFPFTGEPARFVVPDGVCVLRVDAAGGSGGAQGAAGTPGVGARVMATLEVRPGEILLVRVGGQGGTAVGATPGGGGWNGGGAGGAAVGAGGRAGSGGGGATDVRQGGGGLADRIVVAGGGAGGGGGGIAGAYGIGGGEGGDPAGVDGSAPYGSANPATGGRGGTTRAGGAPGASAPHGHIAATAGTLGVGGDGAASDVNGGGGGGGGLYGGGGGGGESRWTHDPLGAAHGGGGSSFGPAGTTYRTGVWGNLGDGRLTIGYDPETDGCGGA